MKVLFLIPKNTPPTLEGTYSKPLKEFVEACLNKEPSFVSAVLSHRDIQRGPPSCLTLASLSGVLLFHRALVSFSPEADRQRAAEA